MRRTGKIKTAFAATKPPSKTPQELGRELIAECEKIKPSPACVKRLIAAGAALDEKDSIGDTVLIKTARSGNAAVVRLLLKAGAALDEQNKNGFTAQGVAKLWRCTEIVSLLKAEAARREKEAAELQALLRNPVTMRDVTPQPIVFKKRAKGKTGP